MQQWVNITRVEWVRQRRGGGERSAAESEAGQTLRACVAPCKRVAGPSERRHALTHHHHHHHHLHHAAVSSLHAPMLQAKKRWMLRALVGEHDHGLSPLGVAQCQRLRTTIAHAAAAGDKDARAIVSRVCTYTSPLSRAIITAHLGLPRTADDTGGNSATAIRSRAEGPAWWGLLPFRVPCSVSFRCRCDGIGPPISSRRTFGRLACVRVLQKGQAYLC
jgi:hypothetical protein